MSKYEILLQVCESGSISKAAQELNYTQSAVSQAVRSFEKEIGAPLFRRSRLLGQILQIFPTFILLIPCVYLLNLFGALDQFSEFTGMIGTALAVLGSIGIFQVIQLAIHLLSWQIDNAHLKEMREAVARGQPYRTPEKLAAKVHIKNGLSCYFYGLVLGMEIVYLLLILLFIN